MMDPLISSESSQHSGLGVQSTEEFTPRMTFGRSGVTKYMESNQCEETNFGFGNLEFADKDWYCKLMVENYSERHLRVRGINGMALIVRIVLLC
jgi:hypothetical protein